jgi:hypothetical protein
MPCGVQWPDQVGAAEVNMAKAWFAALVMVLAGCASISPQDAQLDRTLKHFGTEPDVAGLYVYCDELMQGLTKTNVALDGEPIGQLESLTYLYVKLPPGPHSLRATAGNTDELQLDAEAGHNYFVWQELKLGWIVSGVRLHLVTQHEAEAGLATTRPVHFTYREEDLQAAKARAIAALILGHLIGALPAAGGGTSLIGIGMH